MFVCNENCVDLSLNTKKEVIDKLVEIAYKEGIVTNKEEVLKELYAREEVYSTDVQKYIAIPHTRCEYVTKSSVVILKLNDEVSWESEQDYGVKVVFCILVPAGNSAGNEHLQILSKLAISLMEEDFVKRILDEKKSSYILKLMEENI